MKKEFSFKNYFVYVGRYWLITAVITVLCLGAGLLYGVLSRTDNRIVVTSSVTVSGFSSFTGGELQSDDKGVVEAYNTIRDNAMTAMRSQDVMTKLYREVETAWRAMPQNKKKTEIDARNAFYKALSVRSNAITLYVDFTYKNKTDEAFARNVVTRYTDLAKDWAQHVETALKTPTVANDGTEYEKLTVGETEVTVVSEKKSKGMLKGVVFGAILGVVAGLIVTLILYFADRRINSYGDIAAFTGRKLLGATSGNVTNKVCPRIDCEMQGGKILLVCGEEDMCRRLAGLYGEYAQGAEQKTLVVDFTRSAEGDTFGDFMRGNDLAPQAGVDGMATLSGKQSWALTLTYPDRIAALKAQYGRIVIAAPYRGDGSLGVLAQVADKVVFAVNQSTQKGFEVVCMAQEAQCEQKTIGAVLEKTTKSYVGGSVYWETASEE